MFGVQAVDNFGIPLEKHLKMDVEVGMGCGLKEA